MHLILHLLKHISKNNDNITKDITLAVFIDLSKALDTICHTTLLKIHTFIVFEEILISGLKVTSHKENTVINSCKSTLEDITCGVPQGSIVGPIIFIMYMYINDIKHCTSLNVLSYSDDTTIYTSSSNADALYAEVNKELIKLDDWFRANKLSLNVKKTNYSVFSPTKFPHDVDEILIVNNTSINREHSVRLLGLNIDTKTNMEYPHKQIEIQESKLHVHIMYNTGFSRSQECGDHEVIMWSSGVKWVHRGQVGTHKHL